MMQQSHFWLNVQKELKSQRYLHFHVWYYSELLRHGNNLSKYLLMNE